MPALTTCAFGRRYLGALLLAFATLAAPRAARAQLTVDVLELFVAPGDADAVRTVRVRNDGAERVQAMVVQEDWERDADGTNRFLPLGTHTRSCGEHIDVFPRAIALEPGEAATVRVAVRAGTTPCWGVVFLEHRATQPNGGRQLSYTVRTGVKVYVEPTAARRDGELEAITVDTEADSTTQLHVQFRNTGTSQLAVRGHLEVRTAENQVVHRHELPAAPVLPAAARRLSAPMPSLAPGRYLVLVLLDFGGNELVAGQLDYEVR